MINGAATLPHNATTMAAAVEALGAEFGTPRKVANEDGAVARDSLMHTARQARAERRVTSVLRIGKMQEEEAIAEGADQGKAPPDTRELRPRFPGQGTGDKDQGAICWSLPGEEPVIANEVSGTNQVTSARRLERRAIKRTGEERWQRHGHVQEEW